MPEWCNLAIIRNQSNFQISSAYQTQKPHLSMRNGVDSQDISPPVALSIVK